MNMILGLIVLYYFCKSVHLLTTFEQARLPKMRTRGSRHQHLFEENVRKTKKRGFQILKIRVWELFTHEEDISTPRARYKGRQPIIKCATWLQKLFTFPLFISFCLLGSTRGCPCFHVSSSAMKISDLHSYLKWESLYVKLVFLLLKDSF